jgi:hypothetical protein
MVWTSSKSFQSIAEKSHVTDRKGESPVHGRSFTNFVATKNHFVRYRTSDTIIQAVGGHRHDDVTNWRDGRKMSTMNVGMSYIDIVIGW